MRDAHFYANEGFKQTNTKGRRNAETEHGWHKNYYCCVTTGSHLVRFNQPAILKFSMSVMGGGSGGKRKEGRGGERERNGM